MERRTIKWFSDAKGYGFIRLPTFESLDQVVRIGRSDAAACGEHVAVPTNGDIRAQIKKAMRFGAHGTTVKAYKPQR